MNVIQFFTLYWDWYVLIGIFVMISNMLLSEKRDYFYVIIFLPIWPAVFLAVLTTLLSRK